MTTVWETDLWNKFTEDHIMWRFLLPSVQPELRNRWLKSLIVLLDNMCDDPTEKSLFLKKKLRELLVDGRPEHKTALYLMCLVLYPAVAEHTLEAEEMDIREWIDRDVPSYLEEWLSATHGDQIPLFVAQCILQFRQTSAMNVLRKKAAENATQRLLTN